MLTHMKQAWRIMLAFVLASVMCVPSMAFAADGNAGGGDQSSASDGSMKVLVVDAAGNSKELKSYTPDEFKALSEEVDAGYQYAKGTAINIVAITKMVTFQKLFSDAGADEYLSDDAQITFNATDGPYEKWQPTWGELNSDGYFYPNRSASDATNTEGAVKVPAGFGLPGEHASASAGANLSSDALAQMIANIKAGKGEDGLKAGVGILKQADGSELAAGYRLVGNATSVTIHLPSIADMKISAPTSFYTGDPITPVTIQTPDKQQLVEGTDYTIAYTDNTNVGTAHFTVTGIGKYTGTYEGTFQITDKVLTVAVDGKVIKEYTSSDVAKLLTNDQPLYYQYFKGTPQVYAATSYVTLDALFADAGVSKDWTQGAHLEFSATDGVYGKDKPTYADIESQNHFYPNQSVSDQNNADGAEVVPAVLAYAFGKQDAGQNLASDAAAEAVANAEDFTFATFMRGGWTEDVDGKTTVQTPGWRLPSGVVSIDIETSAHKTFPDVEEGSWYDSSVKFVNNAGVMTGYDDSDFFGVGANFTRAEVAAVLSRIAGATTDDSQNTTGMADVEAGQWYTGAANWAVENGVISGWDNGDGTRSFLPNATVTREQMVTIIANYLKVADGQDTAKLDAMPDANLVDDWAKNSVAWALNNEVISGVDMGSEGRFVQPLESTQREMAAAIFANSIQSGLIKLA